MPPTPKLTAGELLDLGFCVVEVRARNRDKSLGPWQLRAAFVEPAEADYFLQQYQQTGTARVRKP